MSRRSNNRSVVALALICLSCGSSPSGGTIALPEPTEASATVPARPRAPSGPQTLRIAEQHQDEILDVGFSDDGGWMVTGGVDGTVRVWHLPSRSVVLVVSVPGAYRIMSVALSRKATRLAAADDAGNVFLWEGSELLATTSIAGLPGSVWLRKLRFLDNESLEGFGTAAYCRWKLPSLNEVEPCRSTDRSDFLIPISTYGDRLASKELDVESTRVEGHQIYNITLIEPAHDTARQLVPGLSYDARFALGADRLIVADGGTVRSIAFNGSGSRTFELGGRGEVIAVALSAKNDRVYAVRRELVADLVELDVWRAGGQRTATHRIRATELQWIGRLYSAPKDASLLVATTNEGVVAFIDSASGKVLPTTVAQSHSSCSFAPDGRSFVLDTLLFGADTDAPQQVSPSWMTGSRAQFSLRGDLLVFASYNFFTARDARTLGRVAELKLNGTSSVMHSAGNLVAIGTESLLTIWAPRKDATQAIASAIARPEQVAISFDGTIVAVAGSAKLQVFDVASRTLRYEQGDVGAQITALAFGPNNILLVGTSAFRDSVPMLVFSAKGEQLKALSLGQGGARAIALIDDRRVLVAGLDHVLRVVDLKKFAIVREFGLQRPIAAIDVDPAGTKAIVALSGAGAYLVDLANGSQIARVIQTEYGWLIADGQGRYDGLPAAVASVHVVSKGGLVPLLASTEHRYSRGLLRSLLDGVEEVVVAKKPELVVQSAPTSTVDEVVTSLDRSVLVTRARNVLQVWDLRTAKLARTLNVPGDRTDVNPDGTLVAISPPIGQGAKAKIIEVATGRTLREVAGGTIVFHPDGQRVAVSRYDRVDIVSLATGEVERTIDVGELNATALAFSSDGIKLASYGGNERGSVQCFDVATGTRIFQAEVTRANEPQNAYLLRFSSDGSMIAASNGFYSTWIFDLQTKKLRFEIKVSDETKQPSGFHTIADIAFSPNGKRFVTAAAFGPVVIWSLASGREERRLQRAAKVAFVSDRGLARPTRGAIEVVDVLDGSSLFLLGRNIPLGDVAINPIEPSVLADVGEVVRWDAAIGTRLIPAGADRSWSPTVLADSVERLPSLPQPLSTDSRIAWSGDGSTVAVGDKYGLVVRDARSAKTLLSLGRGSARKEDAGLYYALALDRRGRHLATVRYAGSGMALELWDLSRSKRIGRYELPDRHQIEQIAWHPLGAIALFAGRTPEDKGLLLRWNIAGSEPQPFSASDGPGLVAVQFSGDGESILLADETSAIRVIDGATGAPKSTWLGHETNIRAIALSPTGTVAASGGTDGQIVLWDATTGAPKYTLKGHDGAIRGLAFTAGGRLLASVSEDQTIRFWQVSDQPRLLATLVFFGEELIVADASGNYYATRGALDAVGFRFGARSYPVEQFDLLLNRPEKVLATFGAAQPDLIGSLSAAHERRLKRLGLEAARLQPDYELPQVDFDSAVPPIALSSKLRFGIRGKDARHNLDRLQVYVDDVPIYGSAGRKLEQGHRELVAKVELELTHGANKIQVSLFNEQGVESLRATRLVQLPGAGAPPVLHVVALGVSKYRDSGFNLQYAARDAENIIGHFRRSKGMFREVRSHLLVDEQVTRERVTALRSELTQTSPEDFVILFVAGHGLLDSKLNFYFATHDTSFAAPSERALSFENLEGLLDGIPARQKLILVDACHAGEVDRDEVLAAATVAPGVVVRGVQPLVTDNAQPKTRVRDLVSELFAGLRRGSGAVVISASRGAEYALESGKVGNGVFTSAVLEALDQKKADFSKDGRVQVSELRNYVVERVRQLTGGRQSPTMRQENLAKDFVVP